MLHPPIRPPRTLHTGCTPACTALGRGLRGAHGDGVHRELLARRPARRHGGAGLHTQGGRVRGCAGACACVRACVCVCVCLSGNCAPWCRSCLGVEPVSGQINARIRARTRAQKCVQSRCGATRQCGPSDLLCQKEANTVHIFFVPSGWPWLCFSFSRGLLFREASFFFRPAVSPAGRPHLSTTSAF